ncbi:hypothetical protein [Lacrimispora sp.]|uniref:hypothetical protein n=1 Tax=Lacrimispora sp. TaxID=2719234 RepID=UPI0028654BF4|nr:hypothetical protein [Lacrimispora sp.]MDR7813354.1 hypothetical protein [Lacrimispora sp.]
MHERVRLTPLTSEERAFAEENHDALDWCMRTQKLDPDLYDVAAFGYLLAVKKWFARPDLQRWSFKTIVRQSVRSSLSNEQRKQDCRIKTISLDDVIPGTDDLTYGDTITNENIRYLAGERKEIGMKINYGVAIPEAAKLGRTPSIEIEALVEFLVSAHKTMCFEYDNSKQANSKSSTLRAWKKKENRNDFNIYKMAERIFIEKVPVKERRKGNVNENKSTGN